MKKDEVPQDQSRTYGGEKKLFYAVGNNGFEGVRSSGWEVETYATVSAVEAMERQRDEALAQVHAGERSPLAFHMYDRRMDPATLAATTGLPGWRISRHLKPKIFARLSDGILARYAEVLDISLDDLRQVPPHSAPKDTAE